MKLAIAGCGRIASVHYEAIEQLIQDKNYNVSISALIDISEINAKHFQQKHQIDSKIFTDFEEALNQVEFDSVLICAPHDFHETLAIRSFENGKHVLLEKPMAHDLNSALKILKHSKRSGNVFMIAENSQYWPEVNCVHDLLQKKAIGEIITVRASFRQNTSSDIFDSYNLLPGDQLDKAWRFDKKSSGGGITLDGGAHWIRPMRIWCGNVSKTMAKFGYPHPAMEGESLSQAILEFDQNVTGIFEGILTEVTNFSPETPFRVTGTSGELVIGVGGFGVTLFNQEFPEGKKVLEDHGYISSFRHQFDDFYQCVKTPGRQPVASAEFSLGEMKTAFAMERSDREGRWIEIE